MEDEELLQQLGSSTDRVDKLEAELQAIRDQEAALQTRKSEMLKELKAAREVRVSLLKDAVGRHIPKVQIARAAKMDRTNVYKILDGKDGSSNSTTE